MHGRTPGHDVNGVCARPSAAPVAILGLRARLEDMSLGQHEGLAAKWADSMGAASLDEPVEHHGALAEACRMKPLEILRLRRRGAASAVRALAAAKRATTPAMGASERGARASAAAEPPARPQAEPVAMPPVAKLGTHSTPVAVVPEAQPSASRKRRRPLRATGGVASKARAFFTSWLAHLARTCPQAAAAACQPRLNVAFSGTVPCGSRMRRMRLTYACTRCGTRKGLWNFRREQCRDRPREGDLTHAEFMVAAALAASAAAESCLSRPVWFRAAAAEPRVPASACPGLCTRRRGAANAALAPTAATPATTPAMKAPEHGTRACAAAEPPAEPPAEPVAMPSAAKLGTQSTPAAAVVPVVQLCASRKRRRPLGAAGRHRAGCKVWCEALASKARASFTSWLAHLARTCPQAAAAACQPCLKIAFSGGGARGSKRQHLRYACARCGVWKRIVEFRRTRCRDRPREGGLTCAEFLAAAAAHQTTKVKRPIVSEMAPATKGKKKPIVEEAPVLADAGPDADADESDKRPRTRREYRILRSLPL